MAEVKTIARPYAKAAFMCAKNDNDYEKWTAFLKCLSIITSDKSSISLLLSPNFESAQKINLIKQLILTISLKEPELSSNEKFITQNKAVNLLKLLIQNSKLTLCFDIYSQYEALRLHEQKTVRVQVLSPFKVSLAQEKSITDALTRRFKESVEIEIKLDKTLIGGIIIKKGDLVIDGSIKGQLEKFQQALA